MTVHQGGKWVFNIGDGAGTEVFNPVGQVVDVTPPSRTLQIIVDTFLGSDVETKTPAGFVLGQASFTIAHDPDSVYHTQLSTDRDAKADRNFTVTLSTATKDTYAFSGYITNVGSSVSGGDKLTSTVNIDVTGVTEWA
jgi:hypothetical protein